MMLREMKRVASRLALQAHELLAGDDSISKNWASMAKLAIMSIARRNNVQHAVYAWRDRAVAAEALCVEQQDQLLLLQKVMARQESEIDRLTKSSSVMIPMSSGSNIPWRP